MQNLRSCLHTAVSMPVLLLLLMSPAWSEPGKNKRNVKLPAETVDSKAESDAPVEMPPNPTVYLLRDPAIHSELKVSASQKTALLELAAAANEPLWQLRDLPVDSGPGVEGWKQLTKGVSERVGPILTPAQRARLAQIVLQLQGVNALTNPTVARKLEMTDKQQEKIAKFQENYNAALKELRVQAGSGKDLVELNRRAKKLQTELGQNFQAALTASQKSRWNTLVGKPFETSRLLPLSAMAPELRDVDTWVNGEAQTLKMLRGRVVVLHFYTFGCINCIHNFPSYKKWQDQFQRKNVSIIGIHTPETPGEKAVESVRKKAEESGFRFPIAVDNGMKNWQAWNNTMWPSVYVIDKRGYIRYWWYGELNWQGAGGEKYISGKIDELLVEK